MTMSHFIDETSIKELLPGSLYIQLARHLSKPGPKSECARHIHMSETMISNTYKSPFAVVLLVTATLLAVVGRHAATAQGVNPGTCFIDCRLKLISCASGCRIGAGPFPLAIRYCLGQCSLQNFQCIQSCTNPSGRGPPRRPPRRPILPPIFHRPPRPRRPILPPIFHRPPHPRRPILPPIFHRPPRDPAPPPPIFPPPIFPPSSTLDPLPSSSPQASSKSAYLLPLPSPPAQVDHSGKGN